MLEEVESRFTLVGFRVEGEFKTLYLELSCLIDQSHKTNHPSVMSLFRNLIIYTLLEMYPLSSQHI